jgi:hypothetical protein
MKQNDSHKQVAYLKELSTIRLERLLSDLLHEMRRRDSEQVKGDVLAKSKALWMLKSSDQAAEN